MGVVGVVLGTATAALSVAAPADWPMFGQNVQNTATSATEVAITTKHVPYMMPKWTLTTGGDVSARAAVVNGVVYFPDWGGNIWAVNAYTGKVIWSNQVSQYFGATSGSMHSR